MPILCDAGYGLEALMHARQALYQLRGHRKLEVKNLKVPILVAHTCNSGYSVRGVKKEDQIWGIH